jgi:hypothetical protein
MANASCIRAGSTSGSGNSGGGALDLRTLPGRGLMTLPARRESEIEILNELPSHVPELPLKLAPPPTGTPT